MPLLKLYLQHKNYAIINFEGGDHTMKSRAYWNKQLTLAKLCLDEYVSTKEICKFGAYYHHPLTKNEVRTAINALRKEGYSIQGLPFQGYEIMGGPVTLDEGLVHAKLLKEELYNELILFDTVDEAEDYLSQNYENLHDFATMLVSPESHIDFTTDEGIHEVFLLPVHLCILYKNDYEDIAEITKKVANIAIERLQGADHSKSLTFEATIKGHEIYINDKWIGMVQFKNHEKYKILDICLNLNTYHEKLYTGRSTLAAKLMIALSKPFIQREKLYE